MLTVKPFSQVQLSIVMAHLIIDPDEIQRLARISSIKNPQEYRSQFNNATERLAAQLRGSVAESWNMCFPTWLDSLGRVKDLACGVRKMTYVPSYATVLGREFVQAYSKDYRFLIDLLFEMPVNSHEYLCACDLLEMMVEEFHIINKNSKLEELYRIDRLMPPVIILEFSCDLNYDCLTLVGEFLRQVALDLIIN
jgi:hypothetical protein